MKTFSEILKEKRKEQYLSQRQLAVKSGISLRTIQTFEQNIKAPRLWNLVSLADALGCSMDSLVGRKENTDNDLTVKTLHKVVDYIIHDSAEDCCQICANLGDFPEVPDDVEPCPYKREGGCKACRNGMIEFFTNRG